MRSAPPKGNSRAWCNAPPRQLHEAPRTLKRGQTLVALESDLWLVVAKPMIDLGQWVIEMRIVAGKAPAG